MAPSVPVAKSSPKPAVKAEPKAERKRGVSDYAILKSIGDGSYSTVRYIHTCYVLHPSRDCAQVYLATEKDTGQTVASA